MVIKKGLKRNDVNRSAQDHSIVDIVDTQLSDLSLNKKKLTEPKSYNNVPKPYQKSADNPPPIPPKIPTRKTKIFERPPPPSYQTKIPQIETKLKDIPHVKLSGVSELPTTMPLNDGILEMSSLNLSLHSQGSSPLMPCKSPKVAPLAPTSFEPHAEYYPSVEQMGSSTVFPIRDDFRIVKESSLFLPPNKNASDCTVKAISKLVNSL